MLPKIISLAILISLLSACAGAQNPPLPAGEGTGVRETLTPTQPMSTKTFTPSPVPTETIAPTLTPEPTATEAPKKETIKIDVNGDGAPDYKGTVEEEKYIEVTEGEPAAQNMIRISEYPESKTMGFGTQYGYFTGYKRITVESEGQFASMIFFQVKYFRESKNPITVEFSALESEMKRMFPSFKYSLGKRINVGLFFPMGSDFTDQHREETQKASKFTDFQSQLLYPEGDHWLKAKEALDLLKYSDESFLDFKSKTRPGFIMQSTLQP